MAADLAFADHSYSITRRTVAACSNTRYSPSRLGAVRRTRAVAVPSYRLLGVLCNADALLIAEAKAVLRSGGALLGPLLNRDEILGRRHRADGL